MERSHTDISITTGTFIRALVVGVLAYICWVLRDLALLVLTAIVIASAIEPGVMFFRKHKIPRILAVLIMYLGVFGTLFALIYFFFPPIIEDAQNFLSGVPQYLNTLNIPGGVGDTAVVDTAHLTGAEHQAQSILQTLFAFRTAFTDTSSGAIRLVSTFFGGIFSLVLVVVLSFYFALQETGVEDFLKIVSPPKHEAYIVNLWHRAQRKIGLWMQGQLLSSLIGGVIVYLGLAMLTLFGMKYALLLAIITAIAMLVPVFGSVLAAAPAVVVAFSVGGVPLALMVGGLYFIVNQFEAHLIHPLVVNKVVGIPPLLVILALIAGGTLAGFLGVLLAIPVAAALREFVTDLDKNKRAARSVVS